MKRLRILVFTAVLLIFAGLAYGTTEHDNYVYFENIHGFKFHLKDYYITHGQPYDGVASGMSAGKGFIKVEAGRKGSSEAADWFKHRADVAVGDRVVFDSWPDKLNFAVYGDIVVTGKNGGKVKCKDIIIGQGHTGAYNNWWIGGKNANMKKDGNIVWLECPPVDGYCAGTVSLHTIKNRSNIFSMFPRPCPFGGASLELPRHR
ncbi:MAG: hypothetical protein RQ739_15695 [Desulfotignum sp.]|nr:hypothetical protein [Desulfotignum sp.]